MKFWLRELEEIQASKFQWANSVRQARIVPPLSVKDAQIQVASGWRVTGFTREKVPGERDAQLAIMLFHQEHGELWQHFPEMAVDNFAFRQDDAN